MTAASLDETDRRLLGLLQENARYSATELAERVGVSDSTVHNRIERLEEAGVITGYTAAIDTKRTGLRLRFLFVCTAQVSDRKRIAEQALEFPAVTDVTELMTGQQNLQIRAVGAREEEITRLAAKLDDLDLEIDDEVLVRTEHSDPLDYAEVGAGDES